MATPANRVPVRIARGTKANLDTAMAAGDLKEGEICYAEDENGLYVVEGGVLTQAGADLAAATIDELGNVENPTEDSLVYTSFSADNTPDAGEWYINNQFLYLPRFDASETDQALNLRSISGTTDLTITQGATPYVLTNAVLSNDELDDANVRVQISADNIATIDSTITKSGSVTISCPDFPVPSDAPVAEGDVLQYDLTAAKYKPVRADLNFLLDVNTIDTLPADGQQLVWDDTAGRWENGNANLTNLSNVDLGLPVGGEGYEIQQGNYLNSGEFQTNGANGILIDKRSKNGQGDMPKPATDAKFYFSTTAGGPFTELTISGAVGNTGSYAYSMTFVDRGALDAVLTGSTTIYWSLAPGVVDGDSLFYNATSGAFEPASGSAPVDSVNGLTGAVSLGVEELDDTQIGVGTSVSRTPTTTSNNTNSGNVGTSIIGSGYTYWAYEPDGENSGTVLDYLRNTASFPLDVDINGTTVTLDAAVHQTGSGDSNQLRLQHSGLTSTGSITGTPWVLTIPDLALADNQILQYNSSTSKWENADLPADSVTSVAGKTGVVTLALDDLTDVDTTTVAPSDNDLLQYDTGTSEWKPVGAGEVRALLGIGEYADDTAAGSGGVASGALYYNTTNSNYVLKA